MDTSPQASVLTRAREEIRQIWNDIPTVIHALDHPQQVIEYRLIAILIFIYMMWTRDFISDKILLLGLIDDIIIFGIGVHYARGTFSRTIWRDALLKRGKPLPITFKFAAALLIIHYLYFSLYIPVVVSIMRNVFVNA